MKTFQKILVMGFLFFGLIIQAQTYNSGDSQIDIENIKGTSLEKQYLSTQNTQEKTDAPVPSGNVVFINQVGANNNAEVQTTSSSGEINILQNGYGNQTFSRISADKIQHTVVQNGDNNLFIHTNPFSLDAHNSQIIQNGNNQNLEWYGANSISENMKVSMQGEGQTVIVRSFN